MRVRLLGAVVLVLAMLAACSASAAPSTAGWVLAVRSEGNVAAISVLVDNMDELCGYDGFVQKEWYDIKLANGAVIKQVLVSVDPDPLVNLAFNVQAGPTTTTFVITSNLLSFPAILGEATATAGITVTDGDDQGGAVGGATATGLFPGGKFYQARYNSPVFVTFANLVSGPVTVPPYGTTTVSETKAPWQFVGNIYDMQSEFQFDLSPFDLASGTSNFRVREIPEPGGFLAVLTGVVGTVFVLRRRRS
ncbi:MAG: hypothetical protein QHI38_09090 [Armatimonadota bacterium]|nr:hypothetical protein [Armatimonadota bacterium]